MLPDGICHPVRNYLCRDNINGEPYKTSGAGLQIPSRFVVDASLLIAPAWLGYPFGNTTGHRNRIYP